MTAMLQSQSQHRQAPIRQVFPEDAWNELNGASATIERLNVNDILVESYQREIKPAKLRQMIRTWDPRIAGWVTVSLRDNGMLFAVDGQHRVEAVRHLQGKIGPYIDAVVVTGWSSQDEAHFFGKTQDPKYRAAIMPEDTHRAAVIEGDQDALAINKIVTRAGYRIGRTDGESDLVKITAVKAVTTVYERYGPQILADTLEFITSTWGVRETPEHSLIHGVALYLALYPQTNTRALSRKMAKTRLSEWLDGPKSFSKREKKSVPEAVAEMMRGDYHKTRPKAQLPPFGDTLANYRFASRSQASKAWRDRGDER